MTEEMQQRLQTLMARWREARDGGYTLVDAEQAELEKLIEEELNASARRAASLRAETE